MFSNSSRKPCLIDVKVGPHLNVEVGVVKALLGVGVEGDVDIDVTFEDPPGVEVGGVEVHLGVGVDGDIDVDVVVWDAPEVHLGVDGNDVVLVPPEVQLSEEALVL